MEVLIPKLPEIRQAHHEMGEGGVSSGHRSLVAAKPNPETDLFPSICLYNEMLPGLPFRGRAVMTRAEDHDA